MKAFDVLFAIIGRKEPQIIKTDFEAAFINALKHHFPSKIISGCQFHLGQALIRKLKDFKIFNNYKTKPAV